MDDISNKDSYDKIALRWTDERKESFVSKLVIEFANEVKPFGRILDIGCGSGIPHAAYLCDKGFSLTGIDASEKMIDIARTNNFRNAIFEVCDVLEYNPPGTFEGILAWDSLFHLPYHQQDGIYQRIADWLNKGGWFLFSHRGADGEIIDDMFGEKFYYSGLSTNTVRQLLTDAGFEIKIMIEDYEERDMQKGLVVIAKK